MRFSIKIFICTVLIVALAFSAGGYLLISSSFELAEERERDRALEEHLSLRYMLESGIISEELQGNEIDDDTLTRVAEDIAASLRQEAQQYAAQGARSIVLNDGTRRQVYSNVPKGAEQTLHLSMLTKGYIDYSIEKGGDSYNIIISGLFDYDGHPLYLSYIRDITGVFDDRDRQLSEFMLYDIAIVLASAAVVFLVSWLLTRKVRMLTSASRRIAGGEYGQRAGVRSSDEIGDLAASFNSMAAAVEGKIGELEEAAQRKDAFIANFTHELKTPMTSIIGYADMLRSRECDGETVFKAASYIFSEGKRLESLSLKMLDLLLLEKQAFALRPVNGAELLDYVLECMTPAFEQSGVSLAVHADNGAMLAEPDLIKTLLVNLADNARKASPQGSAVEITGHAANGTYLIAVTDHGRGIPQNELGRITEAFYMVDKSRARAQHGAGLGLSIASRIAELHDTKLEIQSIVGLGTSVSLSLALYQAQGEGSGDEE